VCPNSADNGVCLTKVRLTYLKPRYDLSQPVFVNNRVPIDFGISATSLDAAKTDLLNDTNEQNIMHHNRSVTHTNAKRTPLHGSR
jgi:hypothetical protein